jgi:hypothetical protein
MPDSVWIASMALLATLDFANTLPGPSAKPDALVLDALRTLLEQRTRGKRKPDSEH